MTPDQAYFRLADSKVLRAKSKAGTRQAGVPASVAVVGGGSGKAVARTEGGERIELRKGGESLARRLAKEQAGKPALKYRVENGEIVFEKPSEQGGRRRRRKRGGNGA